MISESDNTVGTAPHMPDFSQTKGAFDLMTMYTIMMLLNALDLDTYEYPDIELIPDDQNSISLIERTASMYARGKAEDFLYTFFDRYNIVNPATGDICDNPMKEVIYPRLLCLQAALLKYKETTLQTQPLTTPCLYTSFKEQLKHALSLIANDSIKTHVESMIQLGEIELSLGWDYSGFRIIEKATCSQQGSSGSSWGQYHPHLLPSYSNLSGVDPDYISLGSTSADDLYKKYHNLPSELTYSALAFGSDSSIPPGVGPKRQRPGTYKYYPPKSLSH